MVTQVQPYALTSILPETSKKSAHGKLATAADATTTSTTTTGSSDSNIGSTFLSLLVQELQNQDPTDPMDSTAMVGQMISLNQLDQLVSINQAVGGTSSTNGAEVRSAGGLSAGKSTQTAGDSTASLPTALPFNPNTAAQQQLITG